MATLLDFERSTLSYSKQVFFFCPQIHTTQLLSCLEQNAISVFRLSIETLVVNICLQGEQVSLSCGTLKKV